MFKRFPFLLVMQAAGAGEGGGAGGAGGAPAGGGEEQPKYATMDEVNKALNAALGARDKRFEQSFTKSLDERFAKLSEQFAPKPKDDDHAGANGGESKSKQVDPEVVKLRQQVEAQAKRIEAAEKTAEAERTKARSQKADSLLRASFAKHARAEVVETLVRAHRGDVKFDDDGEPILDLADGSGTTTIDAWADAWAKSDAAKPFIPAPSAGGAGTKQTAGVRGTGNYKNKPREQWSEQDVAEAYADNMKRSLGNAI